ncbi:cobalamin-independent methionine synthase II family protein [Parvimonas sp. KA00067]|uniref:cobalamin-independent methionine synthase II family protein n=1 Tax=Parvimonas TaxID=543311 RepID=UPI0007982D77|nr:cobalamin-independent methionine synthase II family protein [Parvimonas sp. KA00067]KXB66475.1 methionine synthase, vitamin-B12 independent [Parvimonas sp. KA00067]
MKKTFKPFTTSLIGSLPRSKEVMALKRRLKFDVDYKKEYEDLIKIETEKLVKLQEKYSIDIITNGELARDNYVSFVADKIDGVVMMNMGDMLEYIDDKQAFEQILETLDVPSVSIKNAICNGVLKYNKSLVSDEIKFLKKITTCSVKATLPGPYLMTRSMWLPALSKKFYNSKEELGKDVIKILKQEIDNLIEAGVDIIQFDEPVLTEVVFSEGKTRSFMCAALSERKDPTEELIFATSLIKCVMDYMKDKPILSSLHVCRGNWSKNESILLEGPYTPLVPLFEETSPNILALEFSTPRAGELDSLLSSEKIKENSILALGVINPRTDVIETAQSIIDRAKEALKFIPKEKLWLNPDCGFATFSNRPVNTFEIIEKKLEQLQIAKNALREMYE